MNAEEIPFDRRMLEALICPRTQMRLTYDADKQELISEAVSYTHLTLPTTPYV